MKTISAFLFLVLWTLSAIAESDPLYDRLLAALQEGAQVAPAVVKGQEPLSQLRERLPFERFAVAADR